MWVVPEKYRDNTGREFTVVLLDSEGTDAVRAENVNDHAIFVLTVLLSSVLIYNSVGVPTRTDLEALEYPFYPSGLFDHYSCMIPIHLLIVVPV